MKTKDELDHYDTRLPEEQRKDAPSPRGRLPQLASSRFDRLPFITMTDQVVQGGDEWGVGSVGSEHYI